MSTTHSTTNLTNEEQAILDVLAADLPETTRVMNGRALTEEVLLGRIEGPPLDEEELPMPEEYDRIERTAEALVAIGLLNAVETLGTTTFALTDAGVARAGATV